MWLCVGLHLGVGIMGLPLIVLVWLVDRRVALVFAMPFMSVLRVTVGLERMAGAVLVLSVVTFTIVRMRSRNCRAGCCWRRSSAASIVRHHSGLRRRRISTCAPALVTALAIGVPLAMLAREAPRGPHHRARARR